MATDRELERRFAAICGQAETGVDPGSPEGDRSVPVIQHRKKRWPNGPPPTHERDPEVGKMSAGTLKVESVRVTYGPHRKGRQVDLVVGAELPVKVAAVLAQGGVADHAILAELVEIDADRPDPYGFRPVGGAGRVWFSASSLEGGHWDGGGR